MEMLETLWLQLKSLALYPLKTFLPDVYSAFELQLNLLVSITAILIFAPLTMMFLTWLERKVVARIQRRIGPNRVGPFGLFQPFADGVKMFMKEDIVPAKADPILHLLAPILVVVPALMFFSFLPFGKDMLLSDLNVAVIFIMAISSIETLAILMAGWGSHNRYSLISALRAAAQIISYEIPLGFSMVPVLMMAGSMSTMTIVETQAKEGWFIFTPWGFLAFLIFFLSGVAEVNRSPFDVPEAESELIAGFHTEYSGMKFALFYMAEFLGAFAVSAFSATFFFGGWSGPILPSWLWLMIKAYPIMFIMLWFRGSLPRFRVDQLLGFAWKYLLPMSLINIVVATICYFVSQGVLGSGDASIGLTIASFVAQWVIGFPLIFIAHQALTAKKAKQVYESYQRPETVTI